MKGTPIIVRLTASWSNNHDSVQSVSQWCKLFKLINCLL